MSWLTNPLGSAAAGRKPASWGGSRPIILTAIRTQGSANRRQRVRVVKEMDQKSIGLCPRRLESCRCRKCLGRSKPQMLMYECAGAKQKTTCPRNPAYHQPARNTTHRTAYYTNCLYHLLDHHHIARSTTHHSNHHTTHHTSPHTSHNNTMSHATHPTTPPANIPPALLLHDTPSFFFNTMQDLSQTWPIVKEDG